ncbi:ADP-ribosyl cyclase/cyclic ADP-ribose hydrolase 1 [Ornithorhynchus anatinus]|uniref:ADP-ribosyl cyclase/cyclic ADP-ribose hydrolase 1 n=1 Tax=Ornithorhynchus anatinus TaxID=9258 RepID=UPI00028F3DCA|nr:ADP-ribosyl cyclase/cyclic ADP-ribose hydrolase 1 [Ornithorhynchus anatinus]
MARENCAQRAQRGKCLLIVTAVILLSVIVLTTTLLIFKKEKAELQKWQGRGTTENLQEIILGRCFNFIRTVNPDQQRDIDCVRIWKTFKNGFIQKNPCEITVKDYQPLMELAAHSANKVPCNKTLLWSKSYDLAHRFAKAQRDFFTLEDTLLGYIADGITWCGNSESSEVNYQSCPQWNECTNSPESVYWKTASKMFAEAACGVVHVMLNGSLGRDAFKNNSIFGSVEALHLDPKKVHSVQIWVMHNIGGPANDSCKGSSVNYLKSILEKRNIKSFCEDNYRPVKFIQCAENPDHRDCRFCEGQPVSERRYYSSKFSRQLQSFHSFK